MADNPPNHTEPTLIVKTVPVAALQPGDKEAARGFLALLILGAALAAVADWLFWNQPRGWTIGAYGLLLVGATLLRERRRISRPALLVLAALLGLLFQCVIEPTVLATSLALLALVTLALTLREGWRPSAVEWFVRWARIAGLGWLSAFRDAAAWLRVAHTDEDGKPRAGTRLMTGWSLPLALTAVFLAIFAVANPVLARWITDALRELSDFLRRSCDHLPAAGRVRLWALVILAVWALLRFRSGDRQRRQSPAATNAATHAGTNAPTRATAPRSAAPSAEVLVRCLVLFNALFALQSTLDVRYLWCGAQLPSGLTYAAYAHRGAYPLVAAALLAAVFVLVAFRAPGETPALHWARRLVYVWLAQNLFLVVSAAWRLRLYVDAYSLTRLRVAAAVWMLLVLAGLVWILWRIAARRSGAWLVNVNTMTALGVLYACAFVDFDGWIARFNVAHCFELGGSGPPIDVAYLERLGPESLPALAQLAERDVNFGIASHVRQATERLHAVLDDERESWRGWTWRRQWLANGY